MTTQPLFSVLVANYNNGQYIQETLESIYAQTYTNWEIVIVDDGSTDHSRELYKELEKDDRINIFYNQENKGIGYTKRRCVEEAQGAICGFVDPDDTIDAESLAIMVDSHLENEQASIVYSRFYICDESLKVIEISKYQKQCIQNDPMFFNLEHIVGPFATFKKRLYDQTEGLSPKYPIAEDQDLYIKLYEVGECIFIDKYLYYYRVHSKGISSTGDKVMKAKYWHWRVIESAIVRRGLDVALEDVFVQIFSDKNVTDYFSKKYDDIKMFKEVARIINQIKNIFRSK